VTAASIAWSMEYYWKGIFGLSSAHKHWEEEEENNFHSGGRPWITICGDTMLVSI